MTDYRYNKHRVGLRLESHQELFSKIFDGYFKPGKYQDDVYSLINDLELLASRLRSDAYGNAIPDTSQEYKAIKFTYTNYRGETSIRNTIVLSVRYGNTEWHPEDGMLMKAFDLDKFEIREFALKDCDFTTTE